MVETMFVELVLNEDGAPKMVKEGDVNMPVFKDKDGKEVPVDVPRMYQKIIDLGNESKTHRTSLEEMKSKFSELDGVDDVGEWIVSAKEAMESVQNFNEKDWLKVEKVDSMKRQMKEAHDSDLLAQRQSFEGVIAEKETGLKKKDEHIRRLMVSNEFAKHELFAGENRRTTLRPEIAEAYFGKYFKVEEDENTGDLVTRAYYSNGDMIYSRSNPGEPADFTEGMNEIWEKYPGKDSQMRGRKAGSGGSGGSGSDDPPSQIARLQAEYEEAIAAKDTSKAIVLKRKLHELRMQQRAAGRAA